MANYNCTFRTNYFAVKDKEYFDQMIERVKRQSEDISVFEKDGKYAIGGYGSPVIFGDPEDDFLKDLPEDENSFFDELQKCVADDDAVLYKEAGYEKLRYVLLEAVVITSEAIECIDIDKQLYEAAVELLEDENWKTRMDY